MLRKLVSICLASFVLSIFFVGTAMSNDLMVLPGFPPVVVPLCYKEVPGQTISCRKAILERQLNDPNGEEDPFRVIESCEGECTVGWPGLGFRCRESGKFQLEELPDLDDEYKVYEPSASGGNLVTKFDGRPCVIGRKCICIYDNGNPLGMRCAASLDPEHYEIYLQIDFVIVSATPCQ